ncbi:MAG: UDP-N-acetylmuramate--L-alanine ligase [Bacteroidia bacterium]|nr:UDP-N-acetylmuramate--L-alanine ligase [Bacteroidia bacterium]
MDLKNIKTAYFLGIGGIGMSAIARYFNHLGIKVMGYDKTPTALTNELIKEGIDIHFDDIGDDVSNFGFNISNLLVVLTPAIPANHQEWAWFKNNGFNILKRSQVLGLISQNHQTIGVAGTHGKTTTSTLIAHILKQSSVDCNAFLGGISTNYNTNLLLANNESTNNHQITKSPSQQFVVIEADEFDRSFLTLHPSIAIITSTDADHLDIYGEHDELKKSFLDYTNKLVSGGTLIIKKELDLIDDLSVNYLTYSIQTEADIYAKNIKITKGDYTFDLVYKGTEITGLQLGIPGLHNVENAVAASAACLMSGVTENELRAALLGFKGVKRRFEYIIKSENQIYIDDYAHHPEELRAIISSVKNMYPENEIVVAFQPHLFTRTRDFVEGFAESLSIANEVFLLEIYPARELPIEGVTSKIIFDKITSKKHLVSNAELLEAVKTNQPKVFLTLGAGDIDLLIKPIKEILEK